MSRFLAFPAFLLLLAPGAFPAPAAEVQPTTPFLQITREWVRPGKGPRLIRQREAAAHRLAGSGGRAVVGLVSMTAREEVWYLGFYQKLGDLERERARQAAAPGAALRAEAEDAEGDLLVEKNRYLAYYFPHLTYRPDFDWAEMHFLDVITIHVRPGHHLEYLQMRQMAVAGHVRGGLDTHLIMFKIVSGEPGLTYLILRPMRGLSDHDDLRARGFGEPLTPEEDHRMVELQAASVDREDEQFFRVEPRLSQVPPAWARTDPEYWRPAASP